MNYAPRNDRVMHDRLVRFMLEVTIPSALEVRSRPSSHLGKLLLGRTDLDTRINTISSERSCSLKVPFFEDLLLGFGISTRKVIEGLRVRLGSIRGEGEVMILEVTTNAREVNKGLDSHAAKFLWVTDSGTL